MLPGQGFGDCCGQNVEFNLPKTTGPLGANLRSDAALGLAHRFLAGTQSGAGEG